MLLAACERALEYLLLIVTEMALRGMSCAKSNALG